MTWLPPLPAALLAALLQPAMAQPAPAPAMVPIDRTEAAPIIGRQVLDREGAPAGRVVDVLVDGAGQARAMVIDFGGFLGLGQRRIAVSWTVLRFDPGPNTITLLMTAPEIAAAPEFKTSNAMVTPADQSPQP